MRNHALFAWQKKISAPSQTVATERIAPKTCQGQPPTFGSHCSRFHPNRFTLGGVIAERVNAVLLPRRVFQYSPEAKHRFRLVSWSLTSLFSTNMAISETTRARVESYPYPVKEGQRYINLNPGRLFVQQPPKRERDREAHLNYYASAYNRERQLSHRKTKLNQIQQNTRINLNWAIQITQS